MLCVLGMNLMDITTNDFSPTLLSAAVSSKQCGLRFLILAVKQSFHVLLGSFV